jgi:hypothetical protein
LNISIKSARPIDATPTEPMVATVVAGSKAGQMRPQEAKMNQQGVENARRSAAAKLHPSNIHTSTFVQSLIAYLVGDVWTEPHIAELVCLRNGDLLARENGCTAFLRILCTRRALVRAVLALSHMVELTPRERTYLLQRIPYPTRAK